MTTQTISAQRMKAAGVPLQDARWFFAIARPRNFRGHGDMQRAGNILSKCAEYGRKH